MLDDHNCRNKAITLLKREHFLNTAECFIFRAVKKLSEDLSGPITLDVLIEFIETVPKYKEQHRSEVRETIGEIARHGSVLNSDFDFAITGVVYSARQDSYRLSIIRAAEATQAGNLSEVEKIFRQGSTEAQALEVVNDRRQSARQMSDMEFDTLEGRYKCGFKVLDEITGGGRPTELWLWAAYLAEYKSTALMSIAHYNFLQGRSVLFISLEMDRIELQRRLICMHASHLYDESTLTYRAVEFGDMDYEQEEFFKGSVSDFDGNSEYGDIQIWQPPIGVTIDDVGREIDVCCNQCDLDIVALDYLQKLAPIRHRGRLREELNETLDKSKRIALEANDRRGVWLVSGYQTSTDGRKNAEKQGYYDVWGLSETIGAGQIANVIAWSLQTDALKQMKEVKVGLAKSRNSPTVGSRHFLVSDPSIGLLSREPVRLDNEMFDEEDFDLEEMEE
jgi:replicative DNA helicase